MDKPKRFFKLIMEEGEGGSGVTVSANADRDYILRNMVATMMEHEILYDIITTAAGAALYTKEKAESLGISPAELMRKVNESNGEGECTCEKCSKKAEEAAAIAEEDTEPKNQALIDEMKHILNGGK